MRTIHLAALTVVAIITTTSCGASADKNDARTRTIRFEQRGGRADANAEITFRAGPIPGQTVVRAGSTPT